MRCAILVGLLVAVIALSEARGLSSRGLSSLRARVLAARQHTDTTNTDTAMVPETDVVRKIPDATFEAIMFAARCFLNESTWTDPPAEFWETDDVLQYHDEPWFRCIASIGFVIFYVNESTTDDVKNYLDYIFLQHVDFVKCELLEERGEKLEDAIKDGTVSADAVPIIIKLDEVVTCHCKSRKKEKEEMDQMWDGIQTAEETGEGTAQGQETGQGTAQGQGTGQGTAQGQETGQGTAQGQGTGQGTAQGQGTGQGTAQGQETGQGTGTRATTKGDIQRQLRRLLASPAGTRALTQLILRIGGPHGNNEKKGQTGKKDEEVSKSSDDNKRSHSKSSKSSKCDDDTKCQDQSPLLTTTLDVIMFAADCTTNRNLYYNKMDMCNDAIDLLYWYTEGADWIEEEIQKHALQFRCEEWTILSNEMSILESTLSDPVFSEIWALVENEVSLVCQEPIEQGGLIRELMKILAKQRRKK